MEEMYEVLSFVEHGTHCHQAMDCVQGTLLIEYLRERPEIEKQVLFEWFRKIGVCMEQYHRCRKQQNYKCLNPYSIVVTEEREIRLLDMEAPENGFVMKQMQKRAMRDHFVRPMFDRDDGRRNGTDLFAYGKTVRFMLACSSPVPALTKREARTFMRVTEKCMGESRKNYEEFQEVLKVLPEARGKKSPRTLFKNRASGLAWGAAACVLLCFALAVGRQGLALGEENADPGAREQSGDVQAEAGTDFPGGKEAGHPESDPVEHEREELVASAAGLMENYMRTGDTEGLEQAVLLGRELEREALKGLSAAYSELGRTDEAVMAYGRMIDTLEEYTEIETAGLKKMELEAGMESYGQAVQTGQEVLRKIGWSEAVAARISECEAAENTESSDEGRVTE